MDLINPLDMGFLGIAISFSTAQFSILWRILWTCSSFFRPSTQVSINFNSSKYDALMEHTDGVKDELRAISGLTFVHACRTGDDEGMVIAQDDRQAADAAAHQQGRPWWYGSVHDLSTPATDGRSSLAYRRLNRINSS